MLFTSYEFVFLFLPITGILFFLSARHSRGLAMSVLVCASLAFYAYWRILDVLVICVSISFNYALGRILFKESRPQYLQKWLFFGVAVNLLCLGMFKYSAFFLEIVNTVLGLNLAVPMIVLPLGVSFFTFTQIAFLVDVSRRQVSGFSLGNYALFVSYFPHLIAGPILHHKEMMPQFENPAIYKFDSERLALGLSLFAIGLFKKLVIADGVANYSDPVFFLAANGGEVTLIEAWTGALAYSFQLYFDFSGYSDMAIAIAWMFGIRFPINFYSPYKATSIIEFWRRWHMTLSRFLRDYLYIPLGGSRFGKQRTYINLFVTMLLGGIWHGAGWTFMIWGAMHGIFLCCNHLWRQIPSLSLFDRPTLRRISVGVSGLLTFLCVTVAWVFFRADNVSAAFEVLKGMSGVNGVVLPATYEAKLGVVGGWLARAGVEFGAAGVYAGKQGFLALIGIAFITFALPNSSQILGAKNPSIVPAQFQGRSASWLLWKGSTSWALALGAAAAFAMLSGTSRSQFLYFQF